MKIIDILKSEQENTNRIVLHKEGMFWRAYEKSAYLFTLYIKVYKITKKFYKNVNSEVVYLGFPHSALEQILSKTQENKITKNETQIIIDKFEFTNEEFVKWKENLADFKTPEDLSLADKITNFPIANKTPVESQQFLAELQSELQTA